MRDSLSSRQRFSRRTMLKGAALGAGGAAAAVMVGCGDDEEAPAPPEEPESTPESTPEATATAAAVRPTGPQEGSYYSALGGSTFSMDQHRAVTAGGIITYAYDGLVSYDDINVGSVRGVMAESLPEQPDEVTYVFKLRPGIKWQNKAPADGRDFTADDLAWNLQRQVSRELSNGDIGTDFALYGTVYRHVESFQIVDDQTLQIVLNGPKATWLDGMCGSQNVMMYRDVAEQIEADPNNRSQEVIVGTGPYIVEEYDPEGRSTAARNPDWFLKGAGEDVQYFDSIRNTFLPPDVNARRAAFEQKQLDWIGGVLDAGNPYPFQFIQSLVDSVPDLEVQDAGDPNNNRALIMSFQRGPFAIPALRQAYFLAIDRKTVIDSDFAGQGRPDGPIPWPYIEWAIPQEELAQTPGYREDKDLDLQDARALWEAGGGPDIGPVPIVISEGPQGTAAAEWFSAMMKQNLDSDTAVEFVPVTSLFPYLTGETFTAHLGALGAWVSPDPRNRFTLSHHSTGGINFAKYNDPEVDRLIDNAGSTLDREAAIRDIQDAQRILLKDANGGSDCLAGGTYRYLKWPYLNMDIHPWWSYWYRNVTFRSWIDQTDPSFAGREEA